MSFLLSLLALQQSSLIRGHGPAPRDARTDFKSTLMGRQLSNKPIVQRKWKSSDHFLCQTHSSNQKTEFGTHASFFSFLHHHTQNNSTIVEAFWVKNETLSKFTCPLCTALPSWEATSLFNMWRHSLRFPKASTNWIQDVAISHSGHNQDAGPQVSAAWIPKNSNRVGSFWWCGWEKPMSYKLIGRVLPIRINIE